VRHYPVFLDLSGQPCTVIGGGEVAERKVGSLLEAEARVTVISPTLSPGLASLAETHEIKHHARPYRQGDLAGATLAFDATDDDSVHAEIAAEAAQARVWLNVVDRPRFCRFIVPAVLSRGPVSVAMSTAGASPALAKRLRRELEEVIGPEYGMAAMILGKLREFEPQVGDGQEARAQVFTALVQSPLLAALRAGDEGTIDAILREIVGQEITLATLGLSLQSMTDHGAAAS
jgi:siroheme synthase-like protein